MKRGLFALLFFMLILGACVNHSQSEGMNSLLHDSKSKINKLEIVKADGTRVFLTEEKPVQEIINSIDQLKLKNTEAQAIAGFIFNIYFYSQDQEAGSITIINDRLIGTKERTYIAENHTSTTVELINKYIETKRAAP